MFTKKSAHVGKQFAAVHLITESADHYNHLVEHNTPRDIVNYLIEQMGDEFYHVSDWFVTAENPDISDSTSELIGQTISDWWDEE